jgi:SAM-dependent methyltransferase
MPVRYDRAIGYSPLEVADADKLRRLAQLNKGIVSSWYLPESTDTILVAGAGSGLEAACVEETFQAMTIGVDLHITSSSAVRRRHALCLARQDLQSLGLRPGSISFFYCYHVLEHVLDPVAVLEELRRVLKPAGVLFVGFPNRHRLVSYVDTSQRASIIEKIGWNLRDYRYRMQGKFRNEDGAHAGFTEAEFIAAASGLFERVCSVRHRYMLAKYPGFARLLHPLAALGLDEVIYPSNYFVCVKNAT